MKLKPKENLKIIDPATGRPLPAEGAKVVESSYWLRRLAEGDVIEIKEQAAQPKADKGGSK